MKSRSLFSIAATGALAIIIQTGATAQPSVPAAPRPAIYSANQTTNTVTVYLESDHGNVMPRATIAGSNTQLHGPSSVTVSPDGHIFVVNSTTSSIAEFAPQAKGNVAPVAIITCGGLTSPLRSAVDAAGNLYVTNPSVNSISVFKPGSTGCVNGNVVIAGANTKLSSPQGVAVRSDGTLFVANAVSKAITEYAAGSFGNIAPVATISGANTRLAAPTALAFDLTSANVYVSNHVAGGSILEFASNATGNAVPSRMIAGSATLLHSPTGVSVSSTGDIFASAPPSTLLHFASTANGNIAPVGSIIAMNTGPSGMTTFEPVQVVGVRLTGEVAFQDPIYGRVLGYFNGVTSTTSEIVHLTAGDPVLFRNVDQFAPHTASFLGFATSKGATFPTTFNGSSTQSPAGTEIGTTSFSTGALSPGKTSLIYRSSVAGFFMFGCAFHYDSSGMRTVFVDVQ